VVNRHFSFSF